MTLKQNALVRFGEVQSLRRALQSLKMTWQGGGKERFSSQADALQFLAEVTEWEETDRRGAAGWQAGQ